MTNPGLPNPGLPNLGLPNPGLPNPGLPNPGLPAIGLPNGLPNGLPQSLVGAVPSLNRPPQPLAPGLAQVNAGLPRGGGLTIPPPPFAPSAPPVQPMASPMGNPMANGGCFPAGVPNSFGVPTQTNGAFPPYGTRMPAPMYMQGPGLQALPAPNLQIQPPSAPAKPQPQASEPQILQAGAPGSNTSAPPNLQARAPQPNASALLSLAAAPPTRHPVAPPRLQAVAPAPAQSW